MRGTLGFYLLFHIPMIYAGLLTGLITFIICYMEKYGQKAIEIIISILVSIISIAYTIEQAHKSLQPLVGSLSSGAFGIALLASGLSSSVVGTLAGQTIMKGFVNLSIPINVRRLITMLPALAIIALGINPMYALVLSQVALSFILPFPIIQMLTIAKRKDLMGILVNKRSVRFLGVLIATSIIVLNAVLLYLTFTGKA